MGNEALTEALAHFRVVNSRGVRHLIGIRLPARPGPIKKNLPVPVEREPHYGGRRPYWRTFEDFARDITALHEHLDATGKVAKIYTWLPFGDDARG